MVASRLYSLSSKAAVSIPPQAPPQARPGRSKLRPAHPFFSFILLLITACLLSSCIEMENKPTALENSVSIDLYLDLDTSGIGHLFGGVKPVISGAPVSLNMMEYSTMSRTLPSDENGICSFTGLPNGTYRIFTNSHHYFPALDRDLQITGQTQISNFSSSASLDTLLLRSSGINPGIKINEIYYMGPPNKIFYFFDQFIELYNSSTDTLYLDGIQVYRMGPCTVGADNVTYVFQFPGTAVTGREYPIAPGEFKVLAQDARHHLVVQGTDTIVSSIDLSHADWEFVNEDDFADSDDPDIPNIRNIEVGSRTDFMIALGSDIIMIADGRDDDYSNGVDLQTILDCVEYSSKADHEKDITEELDAGFAGVGLTKYSFQSIERISPGFDTDNSTVDFRNYDYPTPGFQND